LFLWEIKWNGPFQWKFFQKQKGIPSENICVFTLDEICGLSVKKCTVPFGRKFSLVFPTNGKHSSHSILFVEKLHWSIWKKPSPVFPYKWKALLVNSKLGISTIFFHSRLSITNYSTLYLGIVTCNNFWDGELDLY